MTTRQGGAVDTSNLLGSTKEWLWSWLTDRGTWLTVVSLLVGSVISWLVSKHYYDESGKELVAETVRLRELHNYTLTVLQNMQAGPQVVGTVERDAQGNPKGVSVTVSSDPLVSGGSAHGGEASAGKN